ncbi:hypothetical protein SSS_10173 [Sarcoptes scabiei]|nr:hypothetical protein SSS_10173 [Sarcoptes scabiei]
MTRFSCHCLNVQLIGQLTSKKEFDEEKEISENLANNNDINKNADDGNLFNQSCFSKEDFVVSNPFFSDSNLVKISDPNGIQINFDYLCIKRKIDKKFSIVHCSVCKMDCYAIWNPKHTDQSDPIREFVDQSSLNVRWIQINPSLISDVKMIEQLHSSPNYSPTFDLVFPSDSISDGKSRSKIDSYNLVPYRIQTDLTDRMQNYLRKEKFQKEDRIKKFIENEERNFKKILDATQRDRNYFFRLIENIKYDHDDDQNDKENRDRNKILDENRNGNTLEKQVLNEKPNRNESQNFSIANLIGLDRDSNRDDFDELFNIDDIENNHNHHVRFDQDRRLQNRNQSFDEDDIRYENTDNDDDDDIDPMGDQQWKHKPDFDQENYRRFPESSVYNEDADDFNNEDDLIDTSFNPLGNVIYEDSIHSKNQFDPSILSPELNNNTSNHFKGEPSMVRSSRQFLQSKPIQSGMKPQFSSSVANHHIMRPQQLIKHSAIKNYSGLSQLRNDSVANSLPIQIPQFERKVSRQIEEF